MIHLSDKEKVEELLKQLGAMLDSQLNPGQKGVDREVAWTIILMPTEAADKTEMFYASNLVKSKITKALKEFIDNFKF